MKPIAENLVNFTPDNLLSGFGNMITLIRNYGNSNAVAKLGIFLGENQRILVDDLGRRGWHSAFYVECAFRPSIENGELHLTGLKFTQLNAETVEELDLDNDSQWRREVVMDAELFTLPLPFNKDA